MIVFDLRCGGGHVFEAWFGSSADYEAQLGRGLVSCPICGDGAVEKAVMAPNVAAKGNRASPAPTLPVAQGRPPQEMKAMMAALARMQARMLEGSEHVGRAFAREARAIQVGDGEDRPIHGQASLAEARELIEEGIAVAPLPFPVAPPEELQ